MEISGTDATGATVLAKVPIADIPPYEAIPRLSPPGILRGRSPSDVGEFRLEINIPESNPLRRLRERLGLVEINGPVTSFPITAFIRMLAKIAHAYAIAEFGPDRIKSKVVPLILGDPSMQFYLVGEFDPTNMQSKNAVQHRNATINGESWLLIEISLHFLPRLPRYQVALGTLPVL